jgi:hypothetical protein
MLLHPLVFILVEISGEVGSSTNSPASNYLELNFVLHFINLGKKNSTVD